MNPMQSDHDALLNTIIANPNDDLPRLVYADFLEENGSDGHAAFIRDQIELANTPDWEPVAVRWRRKSLEEQAGDRWRDSLPWANAWNPRFPFRRGLGYAIKTQIVQHLIDYGDALFASAPIGELHLPGGSMQEYEQLAQQDWLPRVQSVRFWTLTTPTEPVRALSASPLSTGVRAVHFEKASSPGMSFLVERLFQSPLGRQLRELTFRVGDGSQLDLVEALESGGETQLQKLAFDNMGFDSPAVERLGQSRVLSTLRSLSFSRMFFSDVHLDAIQAARLHRVQQLVFHDIGLRSQRTDLLVPLANRVRFPSLRHLDFSRSYGFREQIPPLIRKLQVGLRSLNLSGIRLGEGTIGELTRSEFWPYLVELNLNENALDDGAARELRNATPPRELVTLDLRGNPDLSETIVTQLQSRYGPSVII